MYLVDIIEGCLANLMICLRPDMERLGGLILSRACYCLQFAHLSLSQSTSTYLVAHVSRYRERLQMSRLGKGAGLVGSLSPMKSLHPHPPCLFLFTKHVVNVGKTLSASRLKLRLILTLTFDRKKPQLCTNLHHFAPLLLDNHFHV